MKVYIRYSTICIFECIKNVIENSELSPGVGGHPERCDGHEFRL